MNVSVFDSGLDAREADIKLGAGGTRSTSQSVTGAVAEHVDMHGEWQLGGLTGPLNHPG